VRAQGLLNPFLLAALGLLAAAALGLATSQLTSQQVGISAESVSVGEELVARPAATSKRGGKGSGQGSGKSKDSDADTDEAAASPPAPEPAPTPAPTDSAAADESEGGDDAGGEREDEGDD